MRALILDTETNGKIINQALPMSEVNNFPRVIELAWLVADLETKETLSQFCYLITPDGWQIPKEPFWIEHGFSTEKNEDFGIPMPQVIDYFLKDYDSCDCLVAHNLSFDHPVLGAEMIRYGKKATGKKDRIKICTMDVSTNLCKIPFGKDHRPWKNDKWKFPKLSELYKHLFGKEPDNLHDAMNDVYAVRDCFFELVKREVIKFNTQTV